MAISSPFTGNNNTVDIDYTNKNIDRSTLQTLIEVLEKAYIDNKQAFSDFCQEKMENSIIGIKSGVDRSQPSEFSWDYIRQNMKEINEISKDVPIVRQAVQSISNYLLGFL